MNEDSKTVVVIGTIILAIIIYSWTRELKQVELWFGNTSEMALNLRPGINYQFGLRASATILSTGGLAYIVNKRNISK